MSDARAELAAELFLEQFAKLDDRARRSLTEAIQELQLHSFVLRGGLALRVDPKYAFIEKHEDLVNAYLTLGGWRLHLDRERGLARLYHPESSGRVRFNKAETTILLVMRLLYHEQKRISSESLETVITIGMIREKMAALLPDNALRPFLGRKLLGGTLRRLEKFKIITFDGSSFEIGNETRIKIHPSIEHLITAQNLETLEGRVKELYQYGSESLVDTEETELSIES